MLDLELCLLGWMAVGLVLGLWSILATRAGHARQRLSWPRVLFVVTQGALVASTLVAARYSPSLLVPLGLSAGWLVVAMLWEGPRPARHDAQVLQ